MADTGLSIGTLSGRIDLDDNFTATINISSEALDKLTSHLGGAHHGAMEVAEGMLSAEAAMKVLEKTTEFVVDHLKELTIGGAEVADVEANFEHLTESLGRSGSTMLGILREGTRSTITDFDLIKTISGDLTAGMNLTDQQFKT